MDDGMGRLGGHFQLYCNGGFNAFYILIINPNPLADGTYLR